MDIEKWEYLKVEEFGAFPLSTVELNKYGDAGWELAGFTYHPIKFMYIFKREIKE